MGPAVLQMSLAAEAAPALLDDDTDDKLLGFSFQCPDLNSSHGN